MNLLANKSIDMKVDWLGLDSAFLFSWLSFLTMDVITKRFGPRASSIISVLALIGNLVFAFVLFIASVIPGTWSGTNGDEAIDKIFDEQYGGTWFIIVGSSAAFLSSAIINNFLNWLIGQCFKGDPDSFCAFALRSYVSTAIGQFFDNFVFAIIVSYHFFDWSFVKVISASFLKMLAELIFEVIFSPIGYIYLRYMEKKQIGKEYLDLYQIELKDMTNEEAKQNNDELAAKLNENNKNDNNENSNNLE
jgi:uncharacterized PurR-regulated membrane protein YhhQ (DUF165 family)